VSGDGEQQLRESIKRGRRGLNRVALIFLCGRAKRREKKSFTTEFTEVGAQRSQRRMIHKHKREFYTA
jgi:hypothetical protein